MFEFLIIQPITNLLIFLYVLSGESLGIAIIGFTVLLRLVLLPFTIKQIQAQKKLQELQPKIQKLQMNRKDPSKISPEEIKLMREVSYSCLGGILPLLVQIPILIGLHHVITQIASVNSDVDKSGDFFNKILYFDFLKHDANYQFNTLFWGLDLSVVPSKMPLDVTFVPYLILMAALLFTQYFQSKLFLVNQNNVTIQEKKGGANKKKLTQEELEKVEMQEAINKINKIQMLYMVPILVSLASYSFPVALSFYWLIQNILTIVQIKVQFIMDNGKCRFNNIKKSVFNVINNYKFRGKK